MNEQPDVMANLWMHLPLMVSPNSGRTGTEWPAFHGKVTRLHNDSSIQVNTTIDVLFLVWFFRFQNWLPKRYTYLALLLKFALVKQKNCLNWRDGSNFKGISHFAFFLWLKSPHSVFCCYQSTEHKLVSHRILVCIGMKSVKHQA